MLYRRAKPKHPVVRQGTTTVEFAVILPVFLLVMIGGMQLFRFAMVANTVETAVMEGARKGIIASATDAQIMAAANQVMSQAGLSGHSVSVERVDLGGDQFELQIEATLNVAGNGFLVPDCGSGWQIVRNCSIRME
jgi:Flp pilus assembly protein TadG